MNGLLILACALLLAPALALLWAAGFYVAGVRALLNPRG